MSDLFSAPTSPTNPDSSPNTQSAQSSAAGGAGLGANLHQPLAARMRPTSLEHYIGQSHLLGPTKPLRQALERGHLHSMILWGPPGVGKTTLAHLCADKVSAHFETLSAVLAGVKDVRAAVERAKIRLTHQQQETVLFVDEVHRFNKAQQDAFLPFVEDGTIKLIGATTENPSFALNNALLSRARVYVLKPIEDSELDTLVDHVLQDHANGLAVLNLEISPDARAAMVRSADGDARRLLNTLELAADLADEQQGNLCISMQTLSLLGGSQQRRFDNQGDVFYEQISALHKSVRGSNPDGALYWFARMLDGGADPLYIARRVVRMASEEVGNADPRALQLALQAWQVQERLGSPEGELALAQAVVYLACAPKSNAVYTAFKQVMAEVKSQASYEVPIHLRNAPTTLMQSMSYGEEYRYAHDEPDAYAAGESYFPEPLDGTQYYHPTSRGLEAKIAAKLEHLKALDAASPVQRYPSKSSDFDVDSKK